MRQSMETSSPSPYVELSFDSDAMKHTTGPASHSNSPFDHVGREDVGRMNTFTREFRNAMWVPPWSLDDVKLRLVVYNYAFGYARNRGCGDLKSGMLLRELERLCAAARQKSADYVMANAK